jgi:hypothetical protein
MLDHCLPGHRREEKNHHIWVWYNGKQFQGLQRGHRGKNDPPIGTAHVRKMIRILEVEDPDGCCRTYFPWLAACVASRRDS